jgi:hypothetical protein
MRQRYPKHPMRALPESVKPHNFFFFFFEGYKLAVVENWALQ